MCTMYMTYMYAYIPAHLYLGILGKLGDMGVLLKKIKKKILCSSKYSIFC